MKPHRMSTSYQDGTRGWYRDGTGKLSEWETAQLGATVALRSRG